VVEVEQVVLENLKVHQQDVILQVQEMVIQVEHQLLFQHKLIQSQSVVAVVADQEEMRMMQEEVLQGQIQFFQQLHQQVVVEVEHTPMALVVIMVFLVDQVEQEEAVELQVVQVILLLLARLKVLMVQLVVIPVVALLLQDLAVKLLQELVGPPLIIQVDQYQVV